MAAAAPIPGPRTTTSNTGTGGGQNDVERPQYRISRDNTQATPQVSKVSRNLKTQPEAMEANTLPKCF